MTGMKKVFRGKRYTHSFSHGKISFRPSTEIRGRVKRVTFKKKKKKTKKTSLSNLKMARRVVLFMLYHLIHKVCGDCSPLAFSASKAVSSFDSPPLKLVITYPKDIWIDLVSLTSVKEGKADEWSLVGSVTTASTLGGTFTYDAESFTLKARVGDENFLKSSSLPLSSSWLPTATTTIIGLLGSHGKANQMCSVFIGLGLLKAINAAECIPEGSITINMPSGYYVQKTTESEQGSSITYTIARKTSKPTKPTWNPTTLPTSSPIRAPTNRPTMSPLSPFRAFVNEAALDYLEIAVHSSEDVSKLKVEIYSIAIGSIPKLYSGPHFISSFTRGESYCDGTVTLFYKNSTGWMARNQLASGTISPRDAMYCINLFSGSEKESIEFITQKPDTLAALNITGDVHTGQAAGVSFIGHLSIFDQA